MGIVAIQYDPFLSCTIELTVLDGNGEFAALKIIHWGDWAIPAEENKIINEKMLNNLLITFLKYILAVPRFAGPIARNANQH
jgi:hypothetical protein